MDTLPERLFRETLPNGPARGQRLNKEEFNKMLDEYYRLRGWDENGRPTKEKMEELGLAELLQDMI
jgi:aldehyde:ferredoxin oxidoreductase